MTCTEPEYVAEAGAAGACAPGGNLQEQMAVQVDTGPNGPAGAVPLTQFVATGLPLPGTLAAGTSASYTLRFAFTDLPATANNKAQGDSIAISSTFNLLQV